MTWPKRILVGLVVIVALAASFAYSRISGSLPRLEGEAVVEGLAASVIVERDRAGVPTIAGATREDVGRALGFLHGQERFFQMDLMRRRAAGELAALVGEAALPLDRHHRMHRMRERARRVVEAGTDDERRLLNAYVEGVNAGLSALSVPPFEYLLLGADPQPWRAEDSVLVVLSMFFQLNDDVATREAAAALLFETLPEPLARFLTPLGTEWDAPIVGEAYATPPIPPVSELAPARSARLATAVPLALHTPPEAGIGSNSWAVSGRRTEHGGALLANDMHLGHAVPNIWYRAVLAWEDRRIVGVTLPGTPTMTGGSNGHVAWGFTNSAGDWVDRVVLDRDGERYRTPGGWRELAVYRETIEVRGAEPESLVVRETIWGPLVDETHAVRWIAHDVEGVNLKLAGLETAGSLREALSVAKTSGVPPQNFVCAAADGSIGWTIAGRIPRRVGFDGRRPVSWADGDRGWRGWLSPGEYPEIVDPPEDVLWTANARVVDGEMVAKIGHGGYALGARARQIRDDLLAIETANEEAMLAVQLDDRALFLERWRGLFTSLTAGREDLAGLREVLEHGWTGRASIDSTGYRAVEELREAVQDGVLGALLAPAREKDPGLGVWAIPQAEGPLWKLVSERPPHLVPPPHESWEAALVAMIRERVASWDAPPAARTWGGANVSAIRHPLSASVPLLSRYLDMEPKPLPGDTHMPRVQGRAHGASERLVVSPGREEQGIFHMPGGQSGHPLSPYYGAGHEDWEEGRPTPLLPGETLYRLTLLPP